MRVEGHQAACARTARHWVDAGTIPAHAEGYGAALLASRADLALRDIVDVCNGRDVPGDRLPDAMVIATRNIDQEPGQSRLESVGSDAEADDA